MNFFMCRSRKFYQRRSNFDNFLVGEGREDPNTTISGSLSAILMAFCWLAGDGPTLNAGFPGDLDQN